MIKQDFSDEGYGDGTAGFGAAYAPVTSTNITGSVVPVISPVEQLIQGANVVPVLDQPLQTAAVQNALAENATIQGITIQEALTQTIDTTTAAPVVMTEVPINFGALLQGFGGYLDGILPADIATACGAFSTSMGQVRNIKDVPIEKFAQVVSNLETIKGLDSINGTDVPADIALTSAGANSVALGTGPSGTYTCSDFFGAMSGLPYAWTDIKTNILNLQTSTLQSIYRNLYLAVTWEQATASVQYSSYQVEISPGVFTTYYHVTGVTVTDSGGGYGREGAAAPSITISNGGSASTSIGTSDSSIGPSGTYGRVISATLTSAGSDTTSIPTATVDAPPGSGWPVMNSVIQTYIDQANTEILSIKNNNLQTANKLNTLWNITGTQLTVEQRARNTAFQPVPIPKDIYLSQYPTIIMAFVDSLAQFAPITLPHMYAQTLEAIADLNTAGGQSIVGSMRQERNQTKLLEAGIQLDNDMAGTMTPKTVKLLLANGTVSVAESGIPVDNAIFTIPAALVQNINGELVKPEPIGVYDNLSDNIVVPVQFLPSDVLGNLLDLPQAKPGDDEAGFDPIVTENTGIPSGQLINPIAGPTPSGVPVALDTGKSAVPGSLAGSKYQNTIPAPLQVAYTAGVLTPSTYSVKDAIDQVIKCNCDCWVQ